jgi:2-iminoacetate synthase ThiH
MSRCPYCPFEAQSTEEEIAHMNAEHPQEIARRMTEAGFVRDPRTGEWVDRLSGPD